MNNYLSEVVQIYKSCPSIEQFLDANRIGICVENPFSFYGTTCFSSYPSYLLEGEFYGRFWNEQDPYFFTKSDRPIIFPDRQILLIPQNEQELDYLITLIGKAIIGFFDPNLRKQADYDLELAERGELSLAQYEESTSTHEYQTSALFKKQAQACSSYWPIKFKTDKISVEFPPSAGYLITSTVLHGQLLSKRAKWNDLYQDKYCELSPNDSYSCKHGNTRGLVEEVSAWKEAITHQKADYSSEFVKEILAYFRKYGEVLNEIKAVDSHIGRTKMQKVAELYASNTYNFDEKNG